MFALDTRTLLIVTAIISIGSTIALFSLWRSQSRPNGTGCWAAGMASIALACILIAARGIIPDFITVIVANLLFVIGFSLKLRGIRIFINRPPLLFFDFILPIILMIIFFYFTYINDNFNIRIATISLALVLICSAIIISLVRYHNASWRSAGYAVSAIFGLFAIAHGIRGMIAVIHPFEDTFMSINTSSTLVFITGILTIGGSAITLILLTQAALEAELRIFSMAVKQSASSIIITDTSGAIEYANPAFIHKSGYSQSELIGQNPRILQSGEMKMEVYTELWNTISTGKTWRGEFHNRKKNGELYWEIASIAPVKQKNGYISNYIAIKEDITALKDAEERILKMANHDTLTGLPTRRLSMDRLENAIAVAKRNTTKVAIMFVDLDGFKEVNDSLGHDAGDLVLKETAQRLSACVREVDTVARIGGDEFWILLSNITNANSIATIAEKIIKVVSDTYKVEDTEIKIGASLGIAVYPDHQSNPQELIKLADKAMYEVKRQGKNNYAFAQQNNDNMSQL